MKQFLNILQQFFKKKLNKIYKSETQFSRQDNSFTSLKDLEKAGLAFKPIPPEKIKKGCFIDTSQIPIHILPHISVLKSGVYQIKFSPEIQSRIAMGTFNVTGGVARNQSGQIVAHGVSVNPMVFTSAIFLYQIGVIVFGAHQLQKINKSLKSIQKKLDNIHGFQRDKRSAQISGYFKELSHISKGIFEFNKSGNIKEVLNRIDIIKHIRIKNLTNLLHLQKNLQDNLDNLKYLKRTSMFGSEGETKQIVDRLEYYARDITDYKSSLLLDIILLKTEVCFAMYKSFAEMNSRLSEQEEQLSFFENQQSSYESILNQKILELVKSKFNKNETIKLRRKGIRQSWQLKKSAFPDFNVRCRAEIQSVKYIINSKNNILFLRKSDPDEYKKIA